MGTNGGGGGVTTNQQPQLGTAKAESDGFSQEIGRGYDGVVTFGGELYMKSEKVCAR